MGTLYIVGGPAGDPNDLTRRALRILREVALVVADDVGYAQRVLAHHEIVTSLVAAGEATPLAALAAGDVALMSSGELLGPSSPACRLIGMAAELGYPVVPIPGPAMPVTALVVSGLPSDSFVYLGELPRQHAARGDLLASVAAEQRTLVVVDSPTHLATVLSDLYAVLGNRHMVVVAAEEQGVNVVWRGALGEALGQWPYPAWPSRVALILGAAPERTRWEESRLRTEIRRLEARGLSAREIRQRLAPESGWPRREIYRLAVELARPDAYEGGDCDATANR